MFLNPTEAFKLAPIAVESPQRNEVERGLATESGEPVFKSPLVSLQTKFDCIKLVLFTHRRFYILLLKPRLYHLK